MKIGIDASRMQDGINKTGVEVVGDVVVSKLFQELVNDHGVVLYTPGLLNNFSEKNQRVIKSFRFWTVARLSLEMLLHKPDVFFSPVHELPFFCPAKTYRIVHDVAFLKTPKNYSVFQRHYMNWGLKRSLRICKKIFVSTEAVKNDLLKYYPKAGNKIVVTGFGFDRKNPENNINNKQKQFVYVGRIELKKNISNLITAFEKFFKTNSDYKLILAGKPGFGFDKIKKQVEQSNCNIELLGYIIDEEKNNLQAQSKAVILVSHEEGFGIPVLEGFDMGTRVIVSDIPVLREVGDGVPIYINPGSVESIAQGLEEIIQNDKLNLDKGFSRVGEFSWDIVIDKIKDSLINQ